MGSGNLTLQTACAVVELVALLDLHKLAFKKSLLGLVKKN